MRRSNSARPSVGFASLTWRQRLAYLRAWLWYQRDFEWAIAAKHIKAWRSKP